MIGLRLEIGYIGGAPQLGFSPATQFIPALPGLWADPSDYTTLSQDSAGTTPVTGVTQPDGLMLDKRLGSVRGPELVANGTFDTNTTGWTDSGAAITRVTTIFPGGGAKVTVVNGGANTFATQTLSGLVVGKLYQIKVQAFTPSGQGVDRATIGTQSTSFSTVGSAGQKTLDTVQTLTINFTATAVTQIVYLSVVSADFTAFGLTGSVAHFDDVSFRELPGNHLSQATAAARPLTATQGAVQYLTFDGVDDGLATGAITLSADMDCFFAIRRNSVGRGMPVAYAAGATWFGVWESGNAALAHQAVTPTYVVNGVSVPGGTATTRGQLDTALPVSSWCVLEARNLDLTAWVAINLCNGFGGFFVNGDIGGIILCPAGDATARQKNRQYLGAKVGLSLP